MAAALSSMSFRGPTVWVVYALVLLIAPLAFPSSLGLSVLSQMGCAIIICLSYNILLGQGGMLSFGHAVYSGLGAFAAVHVMNVADAGSWAVPLVLVPVVGGFVGLAAAGLLGFLCTRGAGTTFAMITLGLGELVAAAALMFPGLFGGEGGITANRVYGTSFAGLGFGSALQVYGLIAVYCLVCTAAMFAFTRTPLGHMLNAVRDNAERAAFMGYQPRRVRYLAFLIAGFFAGVGGALTAINFEIATAEGSLGLARSGATLLFTVVGGTSLFFGPVIGGVLSVLASVLLSDLTRAWLLYLGLLFVLTVLVAPGGVAGALVAGVTGVRRLRADQVRSCWRAWLALVVSGMLGLAATACLIEMVYHLQLEAALGPGLRFLGLHLNTSAPQDWALTAGALVLSAASLCFIRQRFVLLPTRAERASGKANGV